MGAAFDSWETNGEEGRGQFEIGRSDASAREFPR